MAYAPLLPSPSMPSIPGSPAGNNNNSQTSDVIRNIVLPQDVVEMGEVAQRHANVNYLLPYPFYVDFWEGSLANGRNATCYFTILFAKVLAMESGDDKGTYLDILKKLINSGWAQTSSIDSKPAHPNVDSKIAILQTLYVLLVFYDIDIEFPPLRALMDANRMQIQKDRSFIEEIFRLAFTKTEHLMKVFVERAVTIEIINDTNPEIVLPEQIFCVVNMVLRDRCLHSKDVKSIFQQAVNYLRNPVSSGDSRVICYMQLIRQLLYLTPTTKYSSGLVKAIAPTIKKKFFMWPWPCGELAAKLLETMSVETKAPGTLFRSVFLKEYPGLLSTNKPTGKENVVHILVDHSDNVGTAIQEILRIQASGTMSLEDLQHSLLLNIFENELKMEADMLGFEYLEKSDLQKLFDAAIEVYSNSILLGREEAADYRLQEFTALKDRAISISASSCRRQRVAKIMRVPPLSFQVFPVLPDSTDPLTSLMPGARIPHRAPTDLLSHIFNQYVPFTERPEKPSVKIVVVGGDSTLHTVTWSYIHLRSLIRKLFDSLDVKFYFIPTTKNSRFASYLCHLDPWYYRQVASIPQSILKVIPSTGSTMPTPAQPVPLSVSLENAEAFTHKATAGFNPSKLLRRSVQGYLREANYTLQVMVFQCECWSEANTVGLYSIPFLQRLEIIPSAQQIKATEVAASGSKLSRYQPPSFSIKFTMMSPNLVQRTAPPLEARQYNSIVLANIQSPFDKDRGAPANPTLPFLEMYLDTDAKRKKYYNYHVSVVEIESVDPSRKFDIIIDSTVFGPFYKIKVSSCQLNNDEDSCKIPLMIYHPHSK